MPLPLLLAADRERVRLGLAGCTLGLGLAESGTAGQTQQGTGGDERGHTEGHTRLVTGEQHTSFYRLIINATRKPH